MNYLSILQLLMILSGAIFGVLAYREWNKKFKFFSFNNPFSPFKYKERFSPKGYKFYWASISLLTLTGLITIFLDLYKWLIKS